MFPISFQHFPKSTLCRSVPLFVLPALLSVPVSALMLVRCSAARSGDGLLGEQRSGAGAGASCGDLRAVASREGSEMGPGFCRAGDGASCSARRAQSRPAPASPTSARTQGASTPRRAAAQGRHHRRATGKAAPKFDCSLRRSPGSPSLSPFAATTVAPTATGDAPAAVASSVPCTGAVATHYRRHRRHRRHCPATLGESWT